MSNLTKQEALDVIREYLTSLKSIPGINEYGDPKIIWALEEYAIPILETEIEMDELVEDILEKDPDAFDRINVVPLEYLPSAIIGNSEAPTAKLSAEEFTEKYCRQCGSQRCTDVDSIWFDGCGYKYQLNVIQNGDEI